MKKSLILATLSAVLMCWLVGCGSDPANEATQTIETADKDIEAESEVVEVASVGEQAVDADVDDILPQDLEASNDENGGDGILVAYFSRADENYNVGFIEKGNTAILAEMIAEITGGDLYEIETVTPYPADYDECTDVAKQEQNDNARPELTGAIENMDQYSVCYLCYPIWWGDLPMPVYSFLDGYDWSGKTIITVNTHEGSGKAGTPEKIQKYLPDTKVIDGIAMTGSTAQNSRDEAKDEIHEWITGLKY